MNTTPVSLVLMHRSARRISQIADRLATDYPDFVVVAQIGAIDELPPGVRLEDAIVLTDSSTFDGQDVVARVRAIRALGSRVVVLDGAAFPAAVVPAMAAGADAVLASTSSSRRVTEQLRLAAQRAHAARRVGAAGRVSPLSSGR